MWRVSYTHLHGYGVCRNFDTKAAAQEFIDVNAMIWPLPNCKLTYISAYREPTLAQLHDLTFGIGERYIDNGITWAEFNWQWQIACAMVDHKLADIRDAFAS